MNDTQLLILDAAALVSTERIRYKHSGFGATFNLPSHELDDRDLMRVLDELECQGLLVSTDETLDKWHRMVAISAEGGHLWDAERKPDWDRYIECYSDGQSSLSIAGYTPQCCWVCLNVMMSVNLVPLNNVNVSAKFCDQKLIYWNPKAAHYRINVSLDGDSLFEEATEQQLADLECRRVWWSNLGELMQRE